MRAALGCIVWALVGCASAPPTDARTFEGRVAWVADGDTLRVRQGRDEAVVRMLYIDAPERDQPGGRDATRALQRLVRGSEVQVRTRGRDRYGRWLGEVVRLPDRLDVNHEMVRSGHAWASARGAQRPRFDAAQRAAQTARIGLWRDADPVPPRVWRHRDD
ncbi:MAG: thermonuclease family protein [Burkholderiales bacterium]|nr:thermonuclease family protein [Burkholderiales bacterium]